MYIFKCEDGSLTGNYSFNSNVGCLTEHNGDIYVRNLNGDSSVINTETGDYTYLGKLIECTALTRLKSLEINEFNYAYMGIAANGNDNHLIFYNYMVNDFAKVYSGETLNCDFEVLYGEDTINKAKLLGADVSNTVYSVVSDSANLSIISYKNGTVSIYDSNSGKTIYEKATGITIDKYFGEDIHGNKYFGNDSAAIMISPSNEIIAAIEDMVGLSSDQTGILMQSFDENCRSVLLKYDIYDRAALLQMAEDKMNYYNFK